MCRARETAVRRWFASYEKDTAGDITVRLLTQRSLGMCPAHTRRLLTLGPSSSWLAKTLFSDATHAGIRALEGNGPRGAPTERCPPCRVADDAAAGTLPMLLDVLDDPTNEPDATTYFAASDGLCLTHARQALSRARRVGSEQVRTVLSEQLADDPVTVLIAVTGYDPDVSHRVRLRRAGSDALLAARTAAEGTRADYARFVLDSWCCPLCAAAVRAEWDQLELLTTSRPAGTTAAGVPTSPSAPPSPSSTSDRLVCPTHLAMLAADGIDDAASATIHGVARRWAADFAAPKAHRRARSGEVTDGCVVCAARCMAHERERRLLDELATDASYRETLSHGHGICLRHGLDAALPAWWRTLLLDRLRLLANELEQARWKDSWYGREEAKGTEATAWWRAPTLLDGQVWGPAGPPSGPGMA